MWPHSPELVRDVAPLANSFKIHPRKIQKHPSARSKTQNNVSSSVNAIESRTSEMTAAEIAYELNFQDNSYFSRFFKKYEGVTPEGFRRQHILG